MFVACHSSQSNDEGERLRRYVASGRTKISEETIPNWIDIVHWNDTKEKGKESHFNEDESCYGQAIGMWILDLLRKDLISQVKNLDQSRNGKRIILDGMMTRNEERRTGRSNSLFAHRDSKWWNSSLINSSLVQRNRTRRLRRRRWSSLSDEETVEESNTVAWFFLFFVRDYGNACNLVATEFSWRSTQRVRVWVSVSCGRIWIKDEENTQPSSSRTTPSSYSPNTFLLCRPWLRGTVPDLVKDLESLVVFNSQLGASLY